MAGSVVGGSEESVYVKREPGARGGSRVIFEVGGFDLSRGGTVLYVPLPRSIAATVSVTLAAGAWGSSAVAVKRPVGGTLLDFASAKSLSAEGAIVLSEEECLGLTEIAVVVTTAAGAFALGVVNVAVEAGA